MANKCIQCGQCCKEIILKLKTLKNNRLYTDYYRKKGCSVVGDTLTIPHICQHLTKENKCAIHNTKKPLLCKMGTNHGIFKRYDGCGFNDS